MAIVITTAAATVNMFMALYNVGKDMFGFSKRKIRHAKDLDKYRDSLEWKKKTLRRSKAGASRRVESFGTETIRLYDHWVERVDKADAKLGQFQESCQNAKSFRKRAQLGERGSVLEKEVDKVEVDGKIFYAPSYRTYQRQRRSQNKINERRQNYGASRNVDSLALAGDTRSIRSWNSTGNSSSSSSISWNSARSGSCSWDRESSNSSSSTIGSKINYAQWDTRSGSSRNSTSTGTSISRSRMSDMHSTGYSTSSGKSNSNWSTVAVTGSPTWSTVAVKSGDRGLRLRADYDLVELLSAMAARPNYRSTNWMN